jgi:gluconate 2-dehydrogenase alpha chain
MWRSNAAPGATLRPISQPPTPRTRYNIRHDLFLRPEQVTLTFRNNADQTALPIRSWGSFMPPNGVGGGVHWNAETWRFLPSDFELRTHLVQRYGERFLPEDMTIQDCGVTYDELEPHYDKFEYLCGTSGKAGNIKGQISSHRRIADSFQPGMKLMRSARVPGRVGVV